MSAIGETNQLLQLVVLHLQQLVPLARAQLVEFLVESNNLKFCRQVDFVTTVGQSGRSQ